MVGNTAAGPHQQLRPNLSSIQKASEPLVRMPKPKTCGAIPFGCPKHSLQQLAGVLHARVQRPMAPDVPGRRSSMQQPGERPACGTRSPASPEQCSIVSAQRPAPPCLLNECAEPPSRYASGRGLLPCSATPPQRRLLCIATSLLRAACCGALRNECHVHPVPAPGRQPCAFSHISIAGGGAENHKINTEAELYATHT